MVTTAHQVGSYGQWVQYEIVVDGHLEARWATWFDGFTISEADDTTVLRGLVVDQAALHGLVQRLRDIGIPLISLTPVEACTHEDATTERAAPDHEGNRP